MKKQVFGLFVVFLMLIGCSAQTSDNPDKTTAQKANEQSQEAKHPELPPVKVKPEQPEIVGDDLAQGAAPKKPSAGNLFDPLKIKAGDTIGGMKVISVQVGSIPGIKDHPATCHIFWRSNVKREIYLS